MPGRGSQAVSVLRDRIDAVFVRADSLPSSELELRSDFAKYLCIVVNGFVETSIAALIVQHCKDRSSPTVHGYVARQADRLQNISAEKLCQILASFNGKWKAELENYIEGARKDALNSVLALRNKAAHGESVSVTIVMIKNYYKSIQEIVNFIEAKLDS